MCSPAEAPGRGMRAEGESGPPKPKQGPPALGKDSYLSPNPVTSIGPPPTAGALNRSHDPSSAGGPRGAVFSHCAALRLLLAFSPPLLGFPGSPLSRASCLPLWIVRWEKKAQQEQLKMPPSRGREEKSSGLFPITSPPPPPPQPTFPGRPAAPEPSPTSDARLPRGPHKAHGSPAAESHRRPAPGPCAQPRSPSRSRSPPAPQQRWQLQFKRLINASRGGGGGRAGPVPRPRPEARGATGCAGQRAGGCARVRRQRGPGAPACAWSAGQTLFSSSVELRLVRRRRPPPPSPSSPAPPRPVRGGRLKGTPRLFLAPRSAPGTPRAARAPRTRAPPFGQSPRPRDVAP
ncbi:unnamed protein product [Rangifer tarandus platyrhynchus]|uniref:Uncharacterized protein n=2 Tax=Rangifer tarandus platyrhynchus TaxID=3082113 RepID=A0ACB0DVH6_RANTA|nr:unnamed protein product [Rangifer tarandus platyrhynchus]CAI9692210.1 unnamed protein product [Rangifer tarandus platyrhynchus]